MSDRVTSENKAPKPNSDSLFDDVWKSAVSSAVGSWEPWKPAPTKQGSLDYFVQGIGGAIGLITDVSLMKYGLGKFAGTGLADSLHVSSILERPGARLFLSGALYGGVFTPVSSKSSDPIAAHFENAAITGGTFLAMDGLMSKFAAPGAAKGVFAKVARQIGVSAVAGVPVGMLNTQIESRVTEGHWQNLSQTLQAGMDWAVVGGALGAMSLPGALRSRATVETVNDRAPASDTTSNGNREFKVVSGQNELQQFVRGQNSDGASLRVREILGRGQGIERSLFVQHAGQELGASARTADIIAACDREHLPTELADKHVLPGTDGSIYMSPGSASDTVIFSKGPLASGKPGAWEPVRLDTDKSGQSDSEGSEQRKDSFPENPYYREHQAFVDANAGSLSGLDQLRSELVKKYSWAIPNEEALDAIKASAGPKGVVEIGAGNGYWADLLRQRGVNVLAFDQAPVETDENHYWVGGNHESWTEVLPGNEFMASAEPERALLLVWPPMESPFAARALLNYTGDTVIYVGEDSLGCTADKDFFGLLRRDWEHVGGVNIPVWSSRADGLDVYVRSTPRAATPDLAELPPASKVSIKPDEHYLVIGDTAIASAGGAVMGGDTVVPGAIASFIDGRVTLHGADDNAAIVYRDDFGKPHLYTPGSSSIWINGEPLQPYTESSIASGDRIKIGDAAELEVKEVKGSDLEQQSNSLKVANGLPDAHYFVNGEIVLTPDKYSTRPLKVAAKVEDRVLLESLPGDYHGLDLSGESDDIPLRIRNKIDSLAPGESLFKKGAYFQADGFIDVTDLLDMRLSDSMRSLLERSSGAVYKLYQGGDSEPFWVEDDKVGAIPANELRRPRGDTITALAEL